jgi:hypothetical protein
MLFWICIILVTALAVWVAWEVTKSGSYPPYQDNTEDMGVRLEVEQHWPFPDPKERP